MALKARSDPYTGGPVPETWTANSFAQLLDECTARRSWGKLLPVQTTLPVMIHDMKIKADTVTFWQGTELLAIQASSTLRQQ